MLQAPVIKNNQPAREQNNGAPEATRH
jgi:hypothetical protein